MTSSKRKLTFYPAFFLLLLLVSSCENIDLDIDLSSDSSPCDGNVYVECANESWNTYYDIKVDNATYVSGLAPGGSTIIPISIAYPNTIHFMYSGTSTLACRSDIAAGSLQPECSEWIVSCSN